jgi:hypothetical protein
MRAAFLALALATPAAAAPCGGDFGDFLMAMEGEAIAAGVCLRVETSEELAQALTGWSGPGPEVIEAFFKAHSGATQKTLAALDAEVKTA